MIVTGLRSTLVVSITFLILMFTFGGLGGNGGSDPRIDQRGSYISALRTTPREQEPIRPVPLTEAPIVEMTQCVSPMMMITDDTGNWDWIPGETINPFDLNPNNNCLIPSATAIDFINLSATCEVLASIYDNHAQNARNLRIDLEKLRDGAPTVWLVNADQEKINSVFMLFSLYTFFAFEAGHVSNERCDTHLPVPQELTDAEYPELNYMLFGEYQPNPEEIIPEPVPDVEPVPDEFYDEQRDEGFDQPL